MTRRWANERSRTDSVRSDLSWAHRIGADDTLDAKLGLSHQQRDTDFHFSGFDRDGEHQLDRNVVSNAIDSSVSTRGKYQAAIGALHTIALGWDGAAIRRGEKRVQTDTSPYCATVYSLDQQYTAQVRQLALFAQGEWAPRPELQAYLGLRWEGLQTRVSGRAFEPVASHSSVFSPVAQMVCGSCLTH